MKQHNLLIGILLLLGLSARAQSPVIHPHPPLFEIWMQFTSMYGSQYPAENPRQHYLPVKDAAGWWIQPVNAQVQVTGPRELFWNAQTNAFISLSFPRQPGEGVKPPSWIKERRYDLHPFYGYYAWPQDVIRLYSRKKVLSERELESLAYAWDVTTARYMHHNDDAFGTRTHSPWDEAFDPRSLPPGIPDSVRRSWQHADSAWAALYARNPAYPLIVGTVPVKRANNRMDNFLNLRMMGYEQEALAWLEGVEYPVAMLAASRNILNSCPQGSILFVNGDNDTYPLLWLQEVQNLRRDITVLNLSLLNTGRYLHYWRSMAPASQRISLRMPESLYRERRMPYWNVKTDVVPLQNFLASLPDTLTQGTVPEMLIFSCPPADTRVDLVQFTRYITLSDMVLLDLLGTGNWRRPLCFSLTTSPSTYRTYASLLYRVGNVKIIQPNPHDFSASKDWYDLPASLAFYQQADLDVYAPDRDLAGMADMLAEGLYSIREELKPVDFPAWKPVLTRIWNAMKVHGPCKVMDVFLLSFVAKHLHMEATEKEMYEAATGFLEALKFKRPHPWKTQVPEDDFYKNRLPMLESFCADMALKKRMQALILNR